MIDKKEIFPIGMGTWKINYQNNDDKKALLYSYSLGQNYLSLYMLYENGDIVKSLKSFIEKCGRENLFISVNIEPTINEKSDIENQLNEYLKILNLDYVDNLQLHSPKFTKLTLIDTYTEMNRLRKKGKTRYLGISNCSLQELKEINANVKLDFFEGVYNLECKINESIGILDYCKKNNIEIERKAIVTVDDEKTNVEQGDLVLIPMNPKHSIDGKVKFAIMCTPSFDINSEEII